MEKIGMKHDKLIINLSKYIIYAWLLFSIIVSLIINRKIDTEHIFMSIIFYSIIFIPIYLCIFSIPINKNYKKRLIKSLLALIPIIISYLFLYLRMDFLVFSSIKIIGVGIILYLLNFSLSANKNNRALIGFTFITTFSSFFIYFIYLNYFVNKDYFSLIGIYNQDEFILSSSIIIIVLVCIIYAFIEHSIMLYKYRKENLYAGNSRSRNSKKNSKKTNIES